jgi:hypothetical protein
MRVEAIFGNGFKLICPVQSCAQKDSTLPVGQIITTSSRRSIPHEGRFAIVTNVGLECGGRGGAA